MNNKVFKPSLLWSAVVVSASLLAGCGGGTDDSPSSSSSGGGSSSSSSGSTSTASAQATCNALKYTGNTSDPQTYYYDQTAQFDQCMYRATGNSGYLTDGNNMCKTLAGLIQATGSKFTPLYCSGSLLKT